MNDIVSNSAELAQRLTEVGLLVNHIEFDGKLHRCSTADKPAKKNGAYIAHGDAPVTIWWKNWATDEEGTITATNREQWTQAERKAFAARAEKLKAQREAETLQRHTDASVLAGYIWDNCTPVECNKHPYLQAKGIRAHGIRRSTYKGANELVIPLLDEASKIQSLQFIANNGTKRLLKGGKKQGGFYAIDADDKRTDGPLCIAEGYATAASLHEAAGFAVLVAFDAGNLEAVATMARTKYPQREIVLCADNDEPSAQYPNPGGVRVAKATEAARAVGGTLAIPRREGCSKLDWNDLHQERGVGEVATQFQMRAEPAPLSENATQAVSKEKLPYGFSLRMNGPCPGLWHTRVKKNGPPVETWVGAPLRVLGMTRDSQSNSWGLLLSWKDADGVAHTWAMPMELLVGSDPTWLGRLVSEGWVCAPIPHARNLVALYLSSFRTERRVRCVPRTGWHNGAYVLPDKVYYQNFSTGQTGQTGQPYGDKGLQPSRTENGKLDKLDNEQIVLQVQAPHNPFQIAGTPDRWKSTVGTWTRGNSRLMLALSAAFAAPLLELCGMESGGFNFTGQSSTGKTTSLDCVYTSFRV